MSNEWHTTKVKPKMLQHKMLISVWFLRTCSPYPRTCVCERDEQMATKAAATQRKTSRNGINKNNRVIQPLIIDAKCIEIEWRSALQIRSKTVHIFTWQIKITNCAKYDTLSIQFVLHIWKWDVHRFCVHFFFSATLFSIFICFLAVTGYFRQRICYFQ